MGFLYDYRILCQLPKLVQQNGPRREQRVISQELLHVQLNGIRDAERR